METPVRHPPLPYAVRTGKSTPGKPKLDGQSRFGKRGQLPENWSFDRCIAQKISLLSLHHQQAQFSIS
jgi:hypothetical protein